MRTDWAHLEQFRHTKAGTDMATNEGDHFGAFFVPHGRIGFVIIASDGTDPEKVLGDLAGWEHVSARVKGNTEKDHRAPTWEEMCWIKQLFWDEEECVVQYHPPRSEYVNNHPLVLHLWKPLNVQMPRPPSILVGIKT